MKCDALVDMSGMRLEGDILDIGFENHGIIYNVYKHEKNDYEVDYFCMDHERKNIIENSYDSCCLFFALNEFKSIRGIKKIIDCACESLKKNGNLYIWDVDKAIFKMCYGRINVKLPDSKIKTFMIRDMNIFNDCSMKELLKFLDNHFDIAESSEWNGIYYIKAQKL